MESVVALTVLLKCPLLLIIEWPKIEQAIFRSHRRNCSVFAGVLSNLDASDASIRLQLAAQRRADFPSGTELCCDARVRNLRGE